MVEARWNIRVPLELDVQLTLPDASRITTRTRNVSFEGMYVNTRLEGVSRHTPVELAFDCGQGPVRTAAEIVRAEPDGTGLRFTSWDDTVADALSVVMEAELDGMLRQNTRRRG